MQDEEETSHIIRSRPNGKSTTTVHHSRRP